MTTSRPMPVPAPCPDGTSVNDYCAALPPQRMSHEAKGLVLYMSALALTVVPFQMNKGGRWECVVVQGDKTYQPGGHTLSFSRLEVETAIEVGIQDVVQVDLTGFAATEALATA